MYFERGLLSGCYGTGVWWGSALIIGAAAIIVTTIIVLIKAKRNRQLNIHA